MKKSIIIITVLLVFALIGFFAFEYYGKAKDKKEDSLNISVEEINKKIDELGIKKLQNQIEYKNPANNEFRTNVNLFETYELKNRILLAYKKEIKKIYREGEFYTEDVLVEKEIFKTEFKKMWNETVSEKTHEIDGSLIKCYTEGTGIGIPNYDIKAKGINYNESKDEYVIDFYISEEMTLERDENDQFIYRYSTKYVAQLKFKYNNNELQLISYMIVEK